MEWQPIETAPKDGTVVLLAGPEFEHGCVIAFWSDPSVGDTTEEDAGWYESESDSHRLFGTPTHWMPLPATPG